MIFLALAHFRPERLLILSMMMIHSQNRSDLGKEDSREHLLTLKTTCSLENHEAKDV